MALIVPAAIGVGSLISGIIGGYYLFKEKEHPKIEETNGIINNEIKVQESNNSMEIITMLRIIAVTLVILIILIFTRTIYKRVCQCKQNSSRNNERQNPQKTEEI